ncbi:MAG TPA: SpvB/TcaC N-terminal domain-containing protein, partial [Usitatibacteraceae bacterium]
MKILCSRTLRTLSINANLMTNASLAIRAARAVIAGLALALMPCLALANPPPTSTSSAPAGKLDGKLGISSAGGATYSIPIKAPPGTAGMVPAISLNYNSGGGNGLMGLGWAINGIGTIERCARTVVQDTVKTGVDMSANDKFCVGGLRLAVIAGTYGAANSEYRTELESFNKIVALGQAGNGPTSFQVTMANGVVMEYGATADSRIIPTGQTGVIIWALNKVRDPRGNYYTVSYTNDAANGQYYPTRIDYTGFTPVSSGTASAPYNSVQFVYDQTRTDVETGYRVGAKSRVTARLINVKTFAGATPVRDYQITYETSTPTSRSRVNNVKECTGDGSACLPPTTFGWNNDSNNFSGTAITWPTDAAQFGQPGSGYYKSIHRDWVDLNGDGRPDFCATIGLTDPTTSPDFYDYDVYCALTQPAGNAPVSVYMGRHTAAYSSWTPQFADINGDGITDFCGADATNACALMGPTGISSNVTRPSWANSYGSPDMSWFVDVNGDGRADLCELSYNGTGTSGTLNCALSTGTAFGTPTPLGTYVFNTNVSCNQAGGCVPVQFDWADVSGDGIPSFCRIDNGSMRCQKWTSNGLAAEVAGTFQWTKDARAWVDINGDGKADFCRIYKGTTFAITCTLSTGTGFGDTITANPSNPGSNYQWVDINGDGKADFCGGASNVTCVLSAGTGFAGAVTSPTGPANTQVPQIVDANGDGRVDVCFGAGYSYTQSQCLPYQGTFVDQLAGVTDGLGAFSTLAYKPISDTTVYTKGSGSIYPTTDIQDAAPVVASVSSSNGIGGSNQTTYSYSGLRAHLQGWGSLAFAAVVANAPSNMRKQTDYLQSYPFIGMAAHMRNTHTVSGNVLSDVVTSFASTGYGGNRYFVFTTLNVIKTYDLNGAFLNWAETASSSYDGFGNPQLVSTVFKDVNGSTDGYSQSVTTAYANDTSNWILDMPTSVAQTNTLPGGSSKTRTTTMSYFANGLLQETIVEPNNGGLAGVTNLRRVTDFAYDAYGNLLTRTVSGANIATRTETTMSYDSRGQFVTTAKNALNQQESRVYDLRFGTPSSLTGPNNLTTTWTYDGFGRQLTEARADGTVTTVSYSQCIGCVTDSAYAIGTTHTVVATGANVAPPARTWYDTLGREALTLHTGFDGRDIYRETLYDSLGRVSSASLNYYAADSVIRWTDNSYDDLGRPTVSLAP